MNSNQPTVSLSLTVNNGNEALDFYTRAFGAKESYRMPMPDGSIAHAEFVIGNSTIYLSEDSEEWHATSMPEGGRASCLFALSVENCDDAYAKAVAAGGTSLMEPADQFWGIRSAMIQDKYGYRWSLGQFLEEVSPEEMGRRAQQLYS